MKHFTTEEVDILMRWAEDNGQYYHGTDREGQRTQHTEAMTRLKTGECLRCEDRDESCCSMARHAREYRCRIGLFKQTHTSDHS